MLQRFQQLWVTSKRYVELFVCFYFIQKATNEMSVLLSDRRDWSRNVTHSVTNDFFFYFKRVKMLAALCVGWVFI